MHTELHVCGEDGEKLHGRRGRNSNDGKARTSSASTMRPPQTSSAAGDVWDGGDGGTELQVVVKQSDESLAHACSQASARTARHRRPHGQTSTTATIRGATWMQRRGRVRYRIFREIKRESNKEESWRARQPPRPRRAAEGMSSGLASPWAEEEKREESWRSVWVVSEGRGARSEKDKGRGA
jgi:hypothetical protein